MNLYKALFEAPIAAMEPEDEPKPAKPTQTKKKANPFDFLDDLGDIGGTSNLPSGPVDAQGDSPKGDSADDTAGPTMPRASGDDTRARMAGRTPTDQMRDMLGRIDMNQDDEISDAEAARRAGLDADNRPDTPNRQVDRVRPADVPMVLNHQLRAAGEQMPEWHTINNLPGYMARAIRGMGRQMFSMMTSTPLEQIMTIANVDGQGPNTDAEMRAVASYLRQHGEDRGAVQVGHGQAVPGYEPDVHEYTAMGMRFHVVRDPMGTYIYAYPEQDARTGGAQDRLPGRDQPRLNRESTMNTNNKTTVAEGAVKQLDADIKDKTMTDAAFKKKYGKTRAEAKKELTQPKQKVKESFSSYLKENLEIYKTRSLLENQYAEELAGYLLNESTLSRLIGEVPGGQNLVRWMHGRHLLSNTAEYASQPFSERVLWTEFKNHPDQFMIISASNGVAGIKPNEADIKRGEAAAAKKNQSYNPARDNTLRYQIVAFRRDEQVDPALFRNPAEVERDADPTVMKARGGMINKRDTRNEFNIFDSLSDQIGSLQAVYISKGRITGLGKRDVKAFTKNYEPGGGQAAGIAGTHGGVEREKIAARRPEQPKGGADRYQEMMNFKNKLKPIVKPLFKRVGNLAMLDVREEARDAMEAGAFERAQTWMSVAKKIETLLISINTQGDIDLNSYNSPVGRLIDRSISDAASQSGEDQGEYLVMLNTTPGAEKLKPFMSALKANLIKANQ